MVDRRRVVAGLVGAAALGGAGAVLGGGRLAPDDDALPLRVDTLDAPGSSWV